jgi:hypothetical protein
MNLLRILNYFKNPSINSKKVRKRKLRILENHVLSDEISDLSGQIQKALEEKERKLEEER